MSDIKETLGRVGVPLDRSVVIGSGILKTLEIRDNADIDVVVDHQLFDSLGRTLGWKVREKTHGSRFYDEDGLEIFEDWSIDGSGHPDYEDLLSHSVTIDGVRYTTLEYLKERKRERGSDKDMKDIELIEDYERRSA